MTTDANTKSADNYGSAFPSEQHETQEGARNQTFDPGMSLRDYFAAKAMQAIASGDFDTFANLAHDAYNIADAMLAERNGNHDE